MPQLSRFEVIAGRRWRAICLTLVLAGLSGSAASARADGLDDAVKGIVDRLASYLKSKGETSISLGQFDGPPQLSATSGPGVSQKFSEHFGRHGIDIRKRAKIGLKGEYALFKGPTGAFGVKLSGSLVDAFGDVLTDFEFEAEPGSFSKVVDQEEDLAVLLGATAELFPEDSKEDRRRDLKDRVLNAQVHVAGSRAAASPTSPYQVEILVNEQPRPLHEEEGMAGLVLQRGEAYAIRLYNNSDYEAAVKVAIDGLNVMTFSTLRDPAGQPKYSLYIIPPHRSVTLRGWHKTNQQVSEFLVTSYADSAAGSLQHTQNLGTITATFAAAWSKEGSPPPDEDATAKGEGNATGFGAPLKQETREVHRIIGRLRAAVSLRYAKPAL